jgi:outer membrane protein
LLLDHSFNAKNNRGGYMKNNQFRQWFIFCSVVIGLLTIPVASFAADAVKFGAIDVQKILNESESGKKAKSDLESLIKSKQSTIDEKGKAIEKLKADIEKQASVLSADARKTKEDELEDELEKSIREYQRIVQDSQSEIKKKEAELTDVILKDTRELIEKTGEEEGYTLIIEKGMVLYSSKGIDITDTVLKRYNESKQSKK